VKNKRDDPRNDKVTPEEKQLLLSDASRHVLSQLRSNPSLHVPGSGQCLRGGRQSLVLFGDQVPPGHAGMD
jgi:hypothetical protein